MDATGAKALRDLINRLDSRTDGPGVPREVLMARLDELDIDPEGAVEQLNDWYQLGEAYQPTDDRVRMVDSPASRDERPFSGWS